MLLVNKIEITRFDLNGRTIETKSGSENFVAKNLEKEYQKHVFARYSKAGILHFIEFYLAPLQMSDRHRELAANRLKVQMNGLLPLCMFTLCNRLMIESLYSELPSIMPVMGFENHSLNSRCD